MDIWSLLPLCDSVDSVYRLSELINAHDTMFPKDSFAIPSLVDSILHSLDSKQVDCIFTVTPHLLFLKIYHKEIFETRCPEEWKNALQAYMFSKQA